MKRSSLRLQVVLGVSITCLVIFSCSYYFSADKIHSGFAEIERHDALVNIARVKYGLDGQYQAMLNKMGDWAQWDDCYKYIKDRNKAFEKANLQPSLTLSKFNLYTFWTLDKKLVWGTNLNLNTENDTEKLIPLSKADIDQIAQVDYLHDFKDFKDKRYVYINLNSGPYLLVSAPITSTDGKSPVNGKIITGIRLDKDFFETLGEQLHLEIEAFNLKSEDGHRHSLDVLNKLQANETYLDMANEEKLDAYGLIKDYKSENLILYEVVLSREIDHQAHKTLNIFLITMILTAIVIVILMYLIINNVVISKLVKLLLVIKHVIATGDLKQQVPDLGVGEIGLLAKTFNEMISEIDKLKTKSIENEKMISLGQMAGSISHEINNPLDIISGRVANIRLKRENNKLTDEYLDQSLNSLDQMVERVSKIIRGLRIISRTADADPFEEKNILEIITETIGYCENRLKQDAVTLKIENNISATIKCRDVQISQVLINLIGNAIDSIREQPERWIEISTKKLHGKLYIYVTDSGAGIPPEIAAKIMTPFFTTKDVGKGTGLGLSISRGIIEDHGGSLTLNADSKNTQFVIELPVLGDL